MSLRGRLVKYLKTQFNWRQVLGVTLVGGNIMAWTLLGATWGINAELHLCQSTITQYYQLGLHWNIVAVEEHQKLLDEQAAHQRDQEDWTRDNALLVDQLMAKATALQDQTQLLISTQAEYRRSMEAQRTTLAQVTKDREAVKAEYAHFKEQLWHNSDGSCAVSAACWGAYLKLRDSHCWCRMVAFRFTEINVYTHFLPYDVGHAVVFYKDPTSGRLLVYSNDGTYTAPMGSDPLDPLTVVKNWWPTAYKAEILEGP